MFTLKLANFNSQPSPFYLRKSGIIIDRPRTSTHVHFYNDIGWERYVKSRCPLLCYNARCVWVDTGFLFEHQHARTHRHTDTQTQSLIYIQAQPNSERLARDGLMSAKPSLLCFSSCAFQSFRQKHNTTQAMSFFDRRPFADDRAESKCFDVTDNEDAKDFIS